MLPVLVMAEMMPPVPAFPGGAIFTWIQFLLATPVVLWGGVAVLRARLGVDRQPQLNMFTLDRAGDRDGVSLQRGGRACPGHVSRVVPRSCTAGRRLLRAGRGDPTLVLLGQVLELRARSQTGSADSRLLGLAPKTAPVVRRRQRGGRPARSGRAGRSAAGPARREDSGRRRRDRRHELPSTSR